MIVSVGEGLGYFTYNSTLTWGVKLNRRTIILTELEYKFWQAAQLSLFTLSEIQGILNRSEIEFYQTKKLLEDKGLIIEWPTLPDEKFLKKFIVLPKGKLIRQSSDKWILTEKMVDEETPYDILPFLIWRNANPSINLYILFTEISLETKQNYHQLSVTSLQWIPYLVKSGFLTVDEW